MKFVQRIIAVVFIIVFARGGIAGSTVNIKTRDDLTLCFMKNGELRKVMIGRHTLKNNGPGGFFARDVIDATEDMFRGRIYRQCKGLFFSSKNKKLGLNLGATIQEQGRKIEIQATIKDSRGFDRAVSFFFAIPVDGLGWTWYDHFRQKRTIERFQKYEESISVPAGEEGKMARYCWSAISNNKVGVSLGIPMDSPAVYRLIYDSQSKKLIIRYDIGLTKDSKIPFTAKVKFILYKIDEPDWGMRSALKKYYEMYPKWFEKRVKKEGSWKNFGRIEDIPNWEDFQFGFHEHPVDAKALEFDRQHGIYSFYYDEPWDFWLPMPKGTRYSYDDVLKHLKQTASKPGIHKNGSSLSSALYDKNQNIIGNFKDTSWNYGGWFPVNCDPELSAANPDGVNAAEYSKQLYLKALTSGEYSGAYFDGSPEYTGQYLNYRRDHFKYANVPLTFSKDENKVVLFNLFTNYAYLIWMSEKVHKLGLLTMCNGSMRNTFGFYNHAIDIPGTEVWWSSGKGIYKPEPDTIMSFRRAFSYQKPYLLLMSHIQNFTHDMVKNYLKRAMAYGMLPALDNGTEKSGDDWKRYDFYNSEMQKRDQNLFREFMPPIIEIASAGWEPLTYAVATGKDILLERFGYADKGTLHFTCFNEGETTSTLDVVIDCVKLGISSQGLYAADILSKKLLPMKIVGTKAKITDISIDSNDVKVFHVGSLIELYRLQYKRTINDVDTLLRDLSLIKTENTATIKFQEEVSNFRTNSLRYSDLRSNDILFTDFHKEMIKEIRKFKTIALLGKDTLLDYSLSTLEKDLEFILTMVNLAVA